MFIIELTYKAELSAIDAAMKEHMAFVRKYYASGHFLVSGRKVPRDGGVLLAVGKDRAEIERIAHEDPFYTQGLCDVRIVEFRVSQHGEALQERIDADAAASR